MSRILVAFASRHGQTREIARTIAARLETRGHLVSLCDVARDAPDPDGHDAVVLGSPVHTGRHAAAIAEYVQRHRDRLLGLPTGFFSVSMSAAQHGAGADPNGYLERFFTQVGWRPTCFAAFGGALRYREYNWFVRRLMRWMAKRGGHATDISRDHVYTDWAAVARFADHIADGLARPAAVTPPASAETAA